MSIPLVKRSEMDMNDEGEFQYSDLLQENCMLRKELQQLFATLSNQATASQGQGQGDEALHREIDSLKSTLEESSIMCEKLAQELGHKAEQLDYHKLHNQQLAKRTMQLDVSLRAAEDTIAKIKMDLLMASKNQAKLHDLRTELDKVKKLNYQLTLSADEQEIKYKRLQSEQKELIRELHERQNREEAQDGMLAGLRSELAGKAPLSLSLAHHATSSTSNLQVSSNGSASCSVCRGKRIGDRGGAPVARTGQRAGSRSARRAGEGRVAGEGDRQAATCHREQADGQDQADGGREHPAARA